MLELQVIRVDQNRPGDACPSPGERQPLKPIIEFGAKPYTEDEEKSLLGVVKIIIDRHGKDLTEKGMS